VGEICPNPPSPPIVAPMDHTFLGRGGESRLRNPLHGNLHGGICEGRQHRQACRGCLLLGNGNSLGVVLSPGGLAAAERSGGSPPGEPQRSAAAAKAGADPVPASRPDPEVVAKAKRRTYTAEYKQRI